MDREIAIVGYRQTQHAEKSKYPRERMCYELVKSLLQSLKITPNEIDTFILCSNDFQEGRTISEVYMVHWVGAYMKDQTKVDSDGASACVYGMMRILSGNYQTALVLAYGMGGSEFRPHRIQEHTLDPIYDRQLKLVNEISAAALQARSYMAKSKMTEEDLAGFAVKSLRNAAKNPFALRKNPDATAGDVLASRPLYTPLRELHGYPPTDGACAILLAAKDRARELTDQPVWIRGVGMNQDTYYIGERNLANVDSLKKAAQRAYKMAGIQDPAKKIGVAEIHSSYVSQEPIFAEAMGLFPKNSGPAVLKRGASEIDGRLPVNPSGGPQGANPYTACGLIRIAEACAQLRGEAEGHQVKKTPAFALAHGQIGLCAQHNTVIVLSR